MIARRVAVRTQKHNLPVIRAVLTSRVEICGSLKTFVKKINVIDPSSPTKNQLIQNHRLTTHFTKLWSTFDPCFFFQTRVACDYIMSSFGKRLLDHQDDPSATASNIGSCTKKAKISSEPTFKNTENQEHCPVNLDVVGKGKQKAVSASQTINPQDPFDVFDADIVRMIITELDAPHTETLRRVSKLWKATSESHCGRTFLRQHFPEVAASLSEDEVGSVKEENLRFRRHCKFCPGSCGERECSNSFGRN